MTDLNFKKITIEDKDLIEKCFTICQPGISEYTFTNIFIWSKPKELLYVKLDEGLIFLAHIHGERYFMPPIGFMDCHKTFESLLEYGVARNIHLIRLIPEYQKKYTKNMPVKIIPDRNSFDYIYKTSSLESLKGWRLDGKRGFIKKFTETYNYKYEQYTEQHKKGCLELAENWASGKRSSDPTVDDELIAIRTFLDNYDRLSSTGGVIIIDEKIIAFIFGEKLNDTTFVIHFEKADHTFTGSYQIINQLFVRNEISGRYLFVNREEDMGIDGIRKAKMSYVPIRLLKKYTVSF